MTLQQIIRLPNGTKLQIPGISLIYTKQLDGLYSDNSLMSWNMLAQLPESTIAMFEEIDG